MNQITLSKMKQWLEVKNTDGQYDELVNDFDHDFSQKVIILGVQLKYDNNDVTQVYEILAKSKNQTYGSHFKPKQFARTNYYPQKIRYRELIQYFDDHSFDDQTIDTICNELSNTPRLMFLSNAYRSMAKTKKEIKAMHAEFTAYYGNH